MKTMAYTPISGVTTTTTSAAIPADQLICASAIITVAGSSPVGTLAMEASNDIIQTGTDVPTNFAQIATVAISAAGSFIIPKTELSYEYVRFVFTLTSGTATSATVRMKAISL